MDEKRAELFDMTEEQLEGIYAEIGLLSKKKPDSPINKFKLKLINEVINKANGLLGKNYVSFSDFKNFDEDEVPTASDVVLILSQYLKSMDKFRFDHTEYDDYKWYWVLDEDSRIQTKKSKLSDVIPD